jgi:hypothetical protein
MQLSITNDLDVSPQVEAYQTLKKKTHHIHVNTTVTLCSCEEVQFIRTVHCVCVCVCARVCFFFSFCYGYLCVNAQITFDPM